MTDDQGFELHPGAAQDITEIWEFIAEDNQRLSRLARHVREIGFQEVPVSSGIQCAAYRLV